MKGFRTVPLPYSTTMKRQSYQASCWSAWLCSYPTCWKSIQEGGASALLGAGGHAVHDEALHVELNESDRRSQYQSSRHEIERVVVHGYCRIGQAIEENGYRLILHVEELEGQHVVHPGSHERVDRNEADDGR